MAQLFNIVLVGFMGAGKTAVGKSLEQIGGYRFIDLDQIIVQTRGKSIPEIFATQGEGAFRQFEAAVLRSLRGTRGAVISTGGGVVGRSENWECMRRFGPVVFLDAPWDILQQRIGLGSGRPLAQAADGWEKVRALWEQRLPLYRQADLTVDGSQGAPDEVARAVLRAAADWSEQWLKK